MSKLDTMMNSPIGGLVIGTGTMGLSIASLIIDWTTAIFGCVGAICGGIIGMRSVYLMIKDELKKRRAKKSLRRRSTDV